MSYMQKFKQMGDELQKELGHFLTGKKHDSKELDKSCRILNKYSNMYIQLQDIYYEYFGAESGRILGDIAKRTSYGLEGEARKEIMMSLIQGIYLPENKVPQGFEEFTGKKEKKE